MSAIKKEMKLLLEKEIKEFMTISPLNFKEFMNVINKCSEFCKLHHYIEKCNQITTPFGKNVKVKLNNLLLYLDIVLGEDTNLLISYKSEIKEEFLNYIIPFSIENDLYNVFNCVIKPEKYMKTLLYNVERLYRAYNNGDFKIVKFFAKYDFFNSKMLQNENRIIYSISDAIKHNHFEIIEFVLPLIVSSFNKENKDEYNVFTYLIKIALYISIRNHNADMVKYIFYELKSNGIIIDFEDIYCTPYGNKEIDNIIILSLISNNVDILMFLHLEYKNFNNGIINNIIFILNDINNTRSVNWRVYSPNIIICNYPTYDTIVPKSIIEKKNNKTDIIKTLLLVLSLIDKEMDTPNEACILYVKRAVNSDEFELIDLFISKGFCHFEDTTTEYRNYINPLTITSFMLGFNRLVSSHEVNDLDVEVFRSFFTF